MSVRVLIVDDSGFFRRRLTEMLNSDKRLEVVGEAADGQEAITQARKLKPDVITMDIEMPVMDGITAVRKIMSHNPVPIIMFSSLSREGAQATFDAMEAGALDYLPKNFAEISANREEVTRELCARVLQLGSRRRSRTAATTAEKKPVTTTRESTPATTSAAVVHDKPLRKGQVKLVAIGTSTGGPVALQDVLTKLPTNFPFPLILIQHMPASFTPAFAKRLDGMCKINVKEAADGDVMKAGTAYLAPGGMQMKIVARGGSYRIRIEESTAGQNYKPCVDITFSSLAEAAPGASLSIILTGMGADGTEGARDLKHGGAAVWSQDEASCVIYGMPMSVAKAGLVDRVLPLQRIGQELAGIG
ncbi:MAG TPA: chemotaxis response regulator protein-glutamate methylesterase [Gammaproteobacteria bacterium]|nr:chemotaxis response regulator protein-glutamate methylesterase [Gammaproteobacteria bacterium]